MKVENLYKRMGIVLWFSGQDELTDFLAKMFGECHLMPTSDGENGVDVYAIVDADVWIGENCIPAIYGYVVEHTRYKEFEVRFN